MKRLLKGAARYLTWSVCFVTPALLRLLIDPFDLDVL